MTKYLKTYLFLIFGTIFGLNMPSNIANASSSPFVVIELFTSQGCESCPPAEAFLRELNQRKNIITLEYHIDYWDYIGWRDPFADPSYTQRQKDYANKMGGRYIYTPQMVFNGKTHEVGSKKSAVLTMISTIEKAANKLTPDISLTSSAGGLNYNIEAQSNIKDIYNVILVGFDGEHITKVTHGENSGESLINSNVVRSMTTIGTWQGQALNATTPILKGNGGCVIMLQHQETHEILSAASIDF